MKNQRWRPVLRIVNKINEEFVIRWSLVFAMASY